MKDDKIDTDKETINKPRLLSTRTYDFEDGGSVTYVGEWDIDKLILRLLRSKYITGND